jgi:hypothetical protein
MPCVCDQRKKSTYYPTSGELIGIVVGVIAGVILIGFLIKFVMGKRRGRAPIDLLSTQFVAEDFPQELGAVGRATQQFPERMLSGRLSLL